MKMFGKVWTLVGLEVNDPRLNDVMINDIDAVDGILTDKDVFPNINGPKLADVMIDTNAVDGTLTDKDLFQNVDVYVRGICVGDIWWEGKGWDFIPIKRYEGIHMLEKEGFETLVEVAEHVGERFGIDIHKGVD